MLLRASVSVHSLLMLVKFSRCTIKVSIRFSVCFFSNIISYSDFFVCQRSSCLSLLIVILCPLCRHIVICLRVNVCIISSSLVLITSTWLFSYQWVFRPFVFICSRCASLHGMNRPWLGLSSRYCQMTLQKDATDLQALQRH